jgi:hypothetical protein
MLTLMSKAWSTPLESFQYPFFRPVPQLFVAVHFEACIHRMAYHSGIFGCAHKIRKGRTPPAQSHLLHKLFRSRTSPSLLLCQVRGAGADTCHSLSSQEPRTGFRYRRQLPGFP